MAATARILKFTEEDLEGSGGGAYAELDVPCDVPIRLREVSDYDKRSEGKTWGWVFTYAAETPSGKEVDFRVWLSFGDNARWKLREILEAHGVALEAGNLELDPEDLVGDELMGHIDFPRDNQGEPTSEFRELQTIYPPSVEPAFSEESDDDSEPAVL
jgi:hypothetical protein